MYNTAVLKATDEQALAKWLVDHGYSFSTEKASELKSYVDEGWYFAIAKIKPSAIENNEVKQELSEGTITPLRLVFKSNQIVYPMKLTRIALDAAKKSPIASGGIVATSSSYLSNTMYIELYVLTDKKVAQSALNLQWANWVNTEEVDKLNAGENWINGSGKLFLTKISNTIAIKDMNDDFVLSGASDNNVYPVPVYKDVTFWLACIFAIFLTLIIGVLSPFGTLFIIFAVLQIFVVKRKWIYALMSVYEFLASLSAVGFLLLVSLGVILNEGVSKAFEEYGFGGFLVGMVILITAGFYFSVKITRHYKVVALPNPNPANNKTQVLTKP